MESFLVIIRDHRDHTGNGQAEREWRTLYCLLRKYCEVPRNNVLLMQSTGIVSVEALIQIHHTRIPLLWRRLGTLGEKHVLKVEHFCYWFQTINPNKGRRPIEDGVVEEYFHWLEIQKIFRPPGQNIYEMPMLKIQKRHSLAYRETFLESSVDRYIRSQRLGASVKYKPIYYDDKDDVHGAFDPGFNRDREKEEESSKEEKRFKAAPYILFNLIPANRGKPAPVLTLTPPSDSELEEAKTIFYAYNSTFLTEVNDSGMDPESNEPMEVVEVVDEWENNQQQLEREEKERRYLWAMAHEHPQPGDGFELDTKVYQHDPVGEETDSKDKDRIREYRLRKEVEAVEISQEMGRKWVEGGAKEKKEILTQLARSDDAEHIDQVIKELYQATVRKEFRMRVLLALCDLKKPAQQRAVVREYFHAVTGTYLSTS